MKTKQVRTTIMIDADREPKDDWQWLGKNRLKPTNLLRVKIKEMRAREDGAPDNETLLKNIHSMQEKVKSLFAFLDTKGLFQEYFDKQKI